MIRLLPPALILLALALFGGCSRGEAAAQPAPAVAPAADGALPRLVFFMNPNGGPCQMQDQILDRMGGELAGKVRLVYYKTTNREDLPKFDEYGIRSLPALVLTDAAGRELRRATPGIQPEDAIRSLIGG